MEFHYSFILLISNLYLDYKKHNCVINYRGFTPNLNKLEEFNYNNRKKNNIKKCLYNFPTGKGGILYHPSFFHKTNQLIFNQDLYLKYGKTCDDIWFYLVRISNGINCFINNTPYMKNDNTNKYGLFKNFNNNKNTENLKIIYNKLKSLSYL